MMEPHRLMLISERRDQSHLARLIKLLKRESTGQLLRLAPTYPCDQAIEVEARAESSKRVAHTTVAVII